MVEKTAERMLREIGVRLQFGLRLQLFWETPEHFVEAQAYRIAYCAFCVAYLCRISSRYRKGLLIDAPQPKKKMRLHLALDAHLSQPHCSTRPSRWGELFQSM